MTVSKPIRLVLAGLIAGLTVQCAAAEDAVLVEGPKARVTANDLLAEIARAPQEVRTRIFSEAKVIASTATNLYVRRVLAERARQEGLQNNESIIVSLRLMEERLLSDVYMARAARAAVPDDEALEKLAASEYKAYPERFERPEQVHVRHILIAPAKSPVARKQAEELLGQLKSGADFAELALKFSADKPSAGRGGDLGYVVRGKTVAPFEAAAFALHEKGQLSDVIESEYGYHIIRLEDRLAKAPQRFEDVRERIKAQLANDFGRNALAELTQQASSEAKPNEAAIQALVRKQ
ncbi:MAG: peptidylprolyl isomerase [Rhodocyclaceae bacterium]|nr:peptidylprolyl isomerase [Rhodocyclaceae bacterium]